MNFLRLLKAKKKAEKRMKVYVGWNARDYWGWAWLYLSGQPTLHNLRHPVKCERCGENNLFVTQYEMNIAFEKGRLLGLYRSTGKRCSCFHCRNKRQDEGLTLREKKQMYPNDIENGIREYFDVQKSEGNHYRPL